jgi:hypothetical protein
METETRIESVQRSETRNGNKRWVIRDADGKEYTTFRPTIGEAAERAEGKRATLEYHEQATGDDFDPDEVAWNTAVEAAPWLLGSKEPETELEPDELYEKLEPFKRRVAEDIRHGGEDD